MSTSFNQNSLYNADDVPNPLTVQHQSNLSPTFEAILAAQDKLQVARISLSRSLPAKTADKVAWCWSCGDLKQVVRTGETGVVASEMRLGQYHNRTTNGRKRTSSVGARRRMVLLAKNCGSCGALVKRPRAFTEALAFPPARAARATRSATATASAAATVSGSAIGPTSTMSDVDLEDADWHAVQTLLSFNGSTAPVAPPRPPAKFISHEGLTHVHNSPSVLPTCTKPATPYPSPPRTDDNGKVIIRKKSGLKRLLAENKARESGRRGGGSWGLE